MILKQNAIDIANSFDLWNLWKGSGGGGGSGASNSFYLIDYNSIEIVNSRNFTAKKDCYIEVETYANDNREEHYYINNIFVGRESINGEVIYLKSFFLNKGDMLKLRDGVSHNTTIRIFDLLNKEYVYNTEEKRIGKWVDGLTLYENIIDCGDWVLNSNLNIDVSELNINDVIFLDAPFHQTNMPNNRGTISSSSGLDNRVLWYDGNTKTIKGSSQYFTNRYIIIRYTKKT